MAGCYVIHLNTCIVSYFCYCNKHTNSKMLTKKREKKNPTIVHEAMCIPL